MRSYLLPHWQDDFLYVERTFLGEFSFLDRWGMMDIDFWAVAIVAFSGNPTCFGNPTFIGNPICFGNSIFIGNPICFENSTYC